MDPDPLGIINFIFLLVHLSSQCDSVRVPDHSYLLGNLVQSLRVLSKDLVFVPVTSSPLLLSLHLNFHWSVTQSAQYSQVSLMALMVVELSKDMGSISLLDSWYSLCYILNDTAAAGLNLKYQ